MLGTGCAMQQHGGEISDWARRDPCRERERRVCERERETCVRERRERALIHAYPCTHTPMHTPMHAHTHTRTHTDPWRNQSK